MGYATTLFSSSTLALLSLPCFACCCWVGSSSSLIMRRAYAMAMYSCVLLALSTAPSLGSAVASFRALHKVHNNNEGRLLSQDARGDSWWWGRKGGLGRGRGLLRCRSSSSNSDNSNDGGGCTVTRAASRQAPSNSGGERGGLVAALALMRGGAGGGYNYDDDYYGGPGEGGGEDPYYEDAAAGGWGDEGGGGRGRDGGRYDRYEDERGAPPKRGGKGASLAGFDLTGTITNGNKKYGVYALAGSVLLTMMGVSLMFEKNLIRLGNLGFVAGMALFIGPSNVVRYFSQSSKLRGSIIFAIGFFFVFTGHPIIGLAIEVFGFLNLFGNMLPMLWAMASNMPFFKDIIGSGASSKKKKSTRSKQKRSSRSSAPRDYDYDQGYGGYEDEEWDNGGGGGGGGGGGWGYDDYDQDRR